MKEYNVEPFKPGPVVNIATGKEIDASIVKGLHEAGTLGNNKFKQFVEDTLVTGSKSIFEPIKKNKIDTGIKEKKNENTKVKPRDTYREYFNDLLGWMIPAKSYSAKKLVMAVERKERRGGKEEGKRIHVTGFDQKMPAGVQKWQEFLSNGENGMF